MGLRRKPGRLALRLFRMPLRAYRHGAGWMLGRTFIELTHIGRRSGRPHRTVAMVLRYDDGPREAVVCAAWGPETDWFRNLQARTASSVALGRERFVPQQRFLSVDEAFAVAVAFRDEHPHRLHLMRSVLGWGDLRSETNARDFVHSRPFIAFWPAEAQKAA